MSVAVDVQIVGLEPLVAGLSAAPEVLQLTETQAMNESVLYAEGEIKLLTPMVTGRLRASWDHQVRVYGGSAEGRVRTEVKYAPYVEYGRGPIEATNARALAFKVGGKTIFRKRVGPAAGRHMAAEGMRASRAGIESIWAKNIRSALKRMVGK